MTDVVASTGRPANAVSIWADNRSIYIELAGQHGPCIISYTRDSIGLAKILELLFARTKEYSGEVYVRPGVVAAYRPKGDFNEAQRERAREVLKKLGIT